MKGKPATRSLAMHSGYVPNYACQSAPFGPTICSLDRHAAFIPNSRGMHAAAGVGQNGRKRSKTAAVTNIIFPSRLRPRLFTNHV